MYNNYGVSEYLRGVTARFYLLYIIIFALPDSPSCQQHEGGNFHCALEFVRMCANARNDRKIKQLVQFNTLRLRLKLRTRRVAAGAGYEANPPQQP